MQVSHGQLQMPVQVVVLLPFVASWSWKGTGGIIQEAREGDKTTNQLWNGEGHGLLGPHRGRGKHLGGMVRAGEEAKFFRSSGWTAVV